MAELVRTADNFFCKSDTIKWSYKLLTFTGFILDTNQLIF